jgi:hypothetical protein
MKKLEDHFHLGMKYFTDIKLIPEAKKEKLQHLDRFISGIPFFGLNGVMGSKDIKDNHDKQVKDQINFFKKYSLPFCWYLDENSNPKLEKTLTENGFTNIGIFRGVIGQLDKNLLTAPEVKGYTFELVTTQQGLKEFNDVVCDVFHLQDTARKMYGEVIAISLKNKDPLLLNWVARYNGKVVSTLSTLIKDGTMSFWNGATLEEHRRKGLSGYLRRLSVEDALKRGCTHGTSYLMSEGKAFGVCSKLGFTTKWRFNAYIAP